MRARAIAVLLLLILPGAALARSPDAYGDLVVVGDAAPPPGAIPLSVVPGFIVLDATLALHDRLLRAPGVERVAWSAPLVRDAWVAGPDADAGGVRSDLALGLTRADELGLTGRGVTVAVLDSGVDALHPDLAGRVAQNVKLVEGRFVPGVGDLDGHGTHVAGIVAASGGSSGGRWRGVAPDAQIVGIDISERFTTASAMLAYDWLHLHRDEHGIRVVVNAWGRVPDGEAFDPGDPTIRAIDRLVDDGVVVVFSASNRGPDPGSISIEAQNPRVLTVGAVDVAGLVMPYSGRDLPGGAKPDVVAPGDAIVGLRSAQAEPGAADPDALHTIYSGTSQAAPHVAGIVALLLEADPGLRPDRVTEILRASAVDLGEAGVDPASGAGLVDARDALRGVGGEPYERDHPLIAGGVIDQRDTAALDATPRRFLGLLDRPTLLWETSFAVEPGAASLDLQLDADAPIDLRAETGPDGQTQIPLRDGRASVAEPQAGVWTLRVHGSLPATTRLEALARITLPAHPERAVEADGRPALPSRAEAAPEVPWIWAIPGFALGGAIAFLAAPRRRTSEDPHLEAGGLSSRER